MNLYYYSNNVKSNVEFVNCVKAISNNIRELNRKHKLYKGGDEFTILEGIKILLMYRLLEPNELSEVAINLLA